jgi:hypothetical protein
MLEVNRRQFVSGMGQIHPMSRTMACPGARQRVDSLLSDTGAQRYVIAPRGMGVVSFDTVPQWAWWAGGGLLAGLIGGAILFKKKG